MDFVIARVEAKDLPVVWPSLQREVRRGLTKGAGDTMTEQWLYGGVEDGSIDLWVLQRRDGEVLGGMFLKTIQRSRGTVLFVVDIVAGSGHGFRDYAAELLPKLREYGAMIGAYTIESVSRPGAARILSRLGCKPKAVIMELGDGLTTNRADHHDTAGSARSAARHDLGHDLGHDNRLDHRDEFGHDDRLYGRANVGHDDRVECRWDDGRGHVLRDDGRRH